MSRELLSFLLSLLLFLHAVPCGYAEENPEVQTSLGKIMGSTMKTRLGRNICAFRGIRYAKPPTGERRFKPPEAIEPWSDTYDATEEGPACPYYNGMNVSEDCLVLNIYTNELPPPDDKNFIKKAVIVFIHQGGFHSSSGQSSIFGPQYLLDQDIVLVTFNFRIGPLGFISTGDEIAPGNLGLKDQVEALRFVQNHIVSFGGDPSMVTLTGQSAGSRSVYLHMMSPMSMGLFHQAICLSGSPATIEPLPVHQKHLAVKLAEVLGCPTENVDAMFTCLKTKPAEDFGNSLPKMQEWHTDPVLIWYPVVEPDIPEVDRFLSAQPLELIRTGNFMQVPIVTGVVRDEMGAFNMLPIEAAKNGDNSIFKDINDNWEKVAPISFMYERDTDRSKFVSKELMKFYFNNQPITLDNAINRAYIYADAITIYPVRRLALLIAGISNQPVYFYQFTYEGPYSVFCWSDGKPYGVAHQDDLFYLFYTAKYPMIGSNGPEASLVDRMTMMWANFAKTGVPISADNNLFKGVTWEKLKPETCNYLEINKDLSMKQNFFPDRMKFWKSLYP